MFSPGFLGDDLRIVMETDLDITARKSCFPPVVDAHTRILILGSLPGEVSLAQQQYYANKQNRFWALTGAVVGEDLVSLAYPERLAALLRHGVGLWDVVAEAHREGSLDSQIRGHASNDLQALIATLPRLAVIAFNGGTAEKIGLKALAGHASRYQLLKLPSSSPAHASVSYADKLVAWKALSRGLVDTTSS